MIQRTLIGLGCLLSTHAFAIIHEYNFKAGATAEYELPVNEPQVFANVFMWTIKAKCTILSTQENNIISFKVLRKTGSINDINLSSGDAMTLTLHPNDAVYITAVTGAKVELLNQSEKAVIASCSAV